MADEVRLIDANALKKTLKDLSSASNNVKQRQIEDSILHGIMPQIIDDEPTLEAEPVKHGRWVVNGDRFYPFCSNCKYEPPKELIRCNALNLEPILTKYCPNCGSENGTRIYRGGDSE